MSIYRKDKRSNSPLRMVKLGKFIKSIVIILTLLFVVQYRGQHQSNTLEGLLTGQCTEDCDQDPLLTDFIFAEMVKPSRLEPVLDNPDSAKTLGQEGQVNAILKHFDNKTNGFFIEAGAWDGEQLSNSIFLETQLGWSGLLVEPNLGAYNLLVGKKRNAYSINSCLATNGYAEKVTFDSADVFGGIDDANDPENDAKKNMRSGWAGGFLRKDLPRASVIVQCFPVFSILMALGNPKVDFFSLDIEGAEMKVLRTIPFDKVDIEIFLIETDKANATELTEMTDFMAGVGYQATAMPPLDHLFVKI